MPNPSTPSAGDGAPAPSRRAFLRGLASLPLIGGSVALIGNPTAAAMTPTRDLLMSYSTWCLMEHRMACFELAGHDYQRGRALVGAQFGGVPSADWHMQWSREGARGPAGWADAPQPSSRAAVILSAAGVPLTGGARV